MKQYGISYTSNGSPPPHGTIVSWHSTIWNNLTDALEGCENDGWRGYVCEYPSGYRPVGGWGSVEEKHREATVSEVRDRIESRRCSGCGLMDRKHDSRDDCIRELFKRVSALEARLDRIGESFSR